MYGSLLCCSEVPLKMRIKTLFSTVISLSLKVAVGRGRLTAKPTAIESSDESYSTSSHLPSDPESNPRGPQVFWQS
jgi:hypothetical protein